MEACSPHPCRFATYKVGKGIDQSWSLRIAKNGQKSSVLQNISVTLSSVILSVSIFNHLVPNILK